ncbi:hypothetical protein B0H13DRAFT_1926747 [Mycena leptocephala]|nr:hypothetical protein B0H13DRAFT_1926747 [Mycena leptocephala]
MGMNQGKFVPGAGAWTMITPSAVNRISKQPRESYCIFGSNTPCPSNMDALPNELFDTIVDFVFGPTDVWTSYAFHRRAFARVSRAWRNRIYENPMWWKTVWFLRFSPEAYILFCLERIGNRQFDLVLDGHEYTIVRMDGRQRIQVTSRSLDVYTERVGVLFMGRLQSICKLTVESMYHPQWMSIINVLAVGKSRTLRCLVGTASSYGQDTRSDEVGPANPVIDAAGWEDVESMKISGVYPLWGGTQIFRNLKELSMSRVWPVASLRRGELVRALKEANRMTILRLNDVECLPDQVTSRIVMPHLTHLYIAYPRDECVDVLTYIAMPALSNLRVDVHGEGTLLALVQKCPHILARAQIVDISDAAGPNGGLERLIPVLDNTTTLDIRRCGLGASSVAMLCIQRNADVLPRLHKLWVDDPATEDEVTTLIVGSGRAEP